MLWLWLREDGQAPKVIARGSRPPGPGKVLEIQARTKAEALRVLQHRRQLERDHGALSAEVCKVLATAHRSEPLALAALQGIREVPEAEQLTAHGAGE